MAQVAVEDASHRFEVHPTVQAHFSWVRTRLALERTLLAWTRTAIALLGFGFTIAKFFDYLDNAAGVKPALLPALPRAFGLILIAASVIVLAISVWQYEWGIRYLRAPPFDTIGPARAIRRNTPAVAVCIVLGFVGVGTFIAVITRAT